MATENKHINVNNFKLLIFHGGEILLSSNKIYTIWSKISKEVIPYHMINLNHIENKLITV